MPRFSGFAQLHDARDLVGKLHHDLARMVANPGDTYAAFDFFVTAEHILDWRHPGTAGGAARRAMRQRELLLQITSHIASGAKHFVTEASHHKSVLNVEQVGYSEEGYVEPGYDDECIVIQLSSDEAQRFAASEIDAVSLARRVLAFWEVEIGRAPDSSRPSYERPQVR